MMPETEALVKEFVRCECQKDRLAGQLSMIHSHLCESGINVESFGGADTAWIVGFLLRDRRLQDILRAYKIDPSTGQRIEKSDSLGACP